MANQILMSQTTQSVDYTNSTHDVQNTHTDHNRNAQYNTHTNQNLGHNNLYTGSLKNDTKENDHQQTNYQTSNDSHNSASGSNMLKHIDTLEKKIAKLQSELQFANSRNEKMAAKTKEGMQSALDTLMKRWMDAVETKDENVKDHFKQGMNKLVQNSAEDNGVWQMMVAASALHERQTHDLDKLRIENEEMRKSIEGRFATPESRKRPADTQMDRNDVEVSQESNMWDEFASEVGKYC